MSTIPATTTVRTTRQVKALSGPLQQHLVATLERLGPSSAKELAARMGRPAEVLYYHLKKLESVGVLGTVDERPTSRRPERVFALAGRELRIDPHRRERTFLMALAGLQKSLMTMATRLYERAVHDPGSRRSGARRNLCVIQQHGRLEARDLAELNRKLEELAEFIAERDDAGVEEFVSVTISMSPSRG